MPGSVTPPEGALARAMAAHRAGDLAQAEALYGQALRRNPDDVHAHYGLGCLHMEAGSLSDAQARFRSALKHDPVHPEALLNLGVVLFRAGALDAAEDALQQALALDPGSVPALHNLGAVLMAQGRGEGALEIAWRTVQAVPVQKISTPSFRTSSRGSGRSTTVAPQNSRAMVIAESRVIPARI